MAVIVAEIYDALRDAQGVSDEKARKAAEAVASFENRFISLEHNLGDTRTSLERRIDDVRAELKRDISDTRSELKLEIADLRGSLRLMQWMLATIVAGLAALLVKAFS